MKKLIRSRPGKETYLEIDPVDKKLVVTSKADVDPVIESVKAERDFIQPGSKDHRVKVAEIPNSIYYELLQKFGPLKHNPTAWKRWLNDPDNRHFRTFWGTI